jgi:hypothetical protein
MIAKCGNFAKASRGGPTCDDPQGKVVATDYGAR